MKKNIYIFFLFSIFIYSCKDKEVFTGSPPEPEEVFGNIYIDSKPQGAQIFLDNKNMGLITPDSLVFLSDKEYSITLKLDLFPDSTFNITPILNSTKKIFIDYTINQGAYGEISCNSFPLGAAIFLEDSSTGLKTPDILKSLFPGFYEVKYCYPEHRSDSLMVTVRGGKTSSLFIELEDTTYWVSYNSSNSWIRSNSITAIFVDNKGYVWFGSNDKGLTRFDGKKFDFFPYSYLPSNSITEIKGDKFGTIWVGTLKGLSKYQDNRWTDYSGIVSAAVTGIDIDNQGVAWIATSDGFYSFKGSSWIRYDNTNSPLQSNYISDVAVEPGSGKVWIGLLNNLGLRSFDGANWISYTTAEMGINPNMGNYSGKLLIDYFGNLWASFQPVPNANLTGGIVKFDGSKWEKLNIPGMVVSEYLSLRNFYSYNEKMFIATNQGVAMFTDYNNPYIYKTANSKIPGNIINDVIVDKSGNLWFVSFNGVVKLKKGNF
ncbi:MAG: PEGA domain-containing protein [Melioribacteraceae bacterium]|nr:PEGA domain-containing protein [Melioribacteraceae bacterium]